MRLVFEVWRYCTCVLVIPHPPTHKLFLYQSITYTSSHIKARYKFQLIPSIQDVNPLTTNRKGLIPKLTTWTTTVYIVWYEPDWLEKSYTNAMYDYVIKWKHFPRYWPSVRGIHRSKASDAGLWYFRWLETLSGPLWRHCNVYPIWYALPVDHFIKPTV